MRFVLLSVLAAFGQTNPHTTPADAEAGGKIFRSHCAECHGFRGEGGKGPNLTTGVFYHGSSDAALFKNITDGLPGTAMPGVFFSADQVWQIVTYVRTLSKTGTFQAPPGNVANGKRIFETAGCAGCHLSTGPDLSFIGSQRPVDFLRKSLQYPNDAVEQDYWQADITLASGDNVRGYIRNEDTYYVQLLSPAKGLMTIARQGLRKYEVRKTSAMPAFRGTETELTDLIAYLWTLQRPRSEQ
jgi:putative heme-binding domain-containing protein